MLSLPCNAEPWWFFVAHITKLKDVRLLILNAPTETAALIEDWFGHLGCTVHHGDIKALSGHEDIARIQIQTYRPNAIVVDLPLTTPFDLWRLQDLIESVSASI